MTNALSFKNHDLFGFMPTFMSNWFDDFGMIPSNFTNSPKVNVKETDKAYEIEIANPGFSKDETKIEVKDGVIHVSMTSESKEDKGTARCRDSEYLCGKERQVPHDHRTLLS